MVAVKTKEELDASSSVDKFLSSTRPRDVIDGTFSGLKVAGAGVLAGGAALIAAPVVGAKEDGVTGFFKGLATGVCGAIGLTLGGAVAGATQLAPYPELAPRFVFFVGCFLWLFCGVLFLFAQKRYVVFFAGFLLPA